MLKVICKNVYNRKAFSGSGLTKMTSVDCCDVDLRDRFGRTPLMYAVLGNYPACIEVIEKKSAILMF